MCLTRWVIWWADWAVHVLVLTSESASWEGDPPERLAELLDQLGCRVTEAHFDPESWVALAGSLPEVIVIDSDDDMGAARRAIEAVAGSALGEIPILLAVGVSRLATLDVSLGFADFVLRPFVPAEVYARLRQIDWKTSAYGSAERIRVGDLVIDLNGREVHVAARKVALTPQEFELLRFLADNVGRAIERDEILRKVWAYASSAATRTVDIHIRRLRAKLGSPWDKRIETVRHVGYKLRG